MRGSKLDYCRSEKTDKGFKSKRLEIGYVGTGMSETDSTGKGAQAYLGDPAMSHMLLLTKEAIRLLMTLYVDDMVIEHLHRQVEAGLVVEMLAEDSEGGIRLQWRNDEYTKMIGVGLGGAMFSFRTGLGLWVTQVEGFFLFPFPIIFLFNGIFPQPAFRYRLHIDQSRRRLGKTVSTRVA